MDCIFCKIIKGQIPSDKVYEDDDILIIKDINPEAEMHYLLLPKEHYSDITTMSASQAEKLGRGLAKLGTMADDLGLSGGFRLISNKGDDACQSVMHLHIHVLGGQKLGVRLV